MTHSPKCEACTPLLEALDEVALLVESYFSSFSNMPYEPPLVGKLDGSLLESSVLQTLGVVSYPALHFFLNINNEVALMEYIGLQGDPADIFGTLVHYWYRHILGPTFHMEGIEDLKSFLSTHGNGLFGGMGMAINPDYTQGERQLISWLMEDHVVDPPVILIQCRRSVDDGIDIAFKDLAQVMMTHRNLAFFSLKECFDNDEGDVVSFVLGPDWALGAMSTKPSHLRVDQFAVLRTSPSLLWFDRVSTAPIAFPAYRKIHAALIIPLRRDENARRSVAAFGRICAKTRLERSEDMVCLVIPDTEIRVLTTLGVDIWSSLDRKVSNGAVFPKPVPTLFITDQREAVLRLYHLNASAIMSSEDAIDAFIEDYWERKISPEIKSSSQATETNRHGVEIISGSTFTESILRRTHKHSLLYISSPTCGHCKRFSIVWNELARMISSIGWNSTVDVLEMDITRNEIVSDGINIDPALLPAVYYFPLDKKSQVVEYMDNDQSGDGVGRVSEAIEIVEWMLTVGRGFDEEMLLEELENLTVK